MTYCRVFTSTIVLCLLGANPVWAQNSRPVKQEIFALEPSFDGETGEISYTLPEPALVRIRIGLSRGRAVLINLIDWEQRDQGRHTEIWDFKDPSGKIDFGKRDDYMITISCIPVKKEELEIYRASVRGYRHSPRFEISFPDSRLKDGIPQFKDGDAVRVTLNHEDEKWLRETKYELGLFINHAFLMEEEEGINPFTYRLNAKGLGAGRHMVTINVISYTGEIGTQTVWFDVLQPKERLAEHAAETKDVL